MRHGGSQKKAHTAWHHADSTHMHILINLWILFTSLWVAHFSILIAVSPLSLSMVVCACLCVFVRRVIAQTVLTLQGTEHTVLSLFPRWILSLSHSSPYAVHRSCCCAPLPPSPQHNRLANNRLPPTNEFSVSTLNTLPFPSLLLPLFFCLCHRLCPLLTEQ